MKTQIFVLARLVVLAIALTACSSTTASVATSPTPSPAYVTSTVEQFEATVHYGPDAGLSLHGTLVVQVDQHGGLSGTLNETNGQHVTLVGQVNGRAINLVFDLGNGTYVYGVGTQQCTTSTCKGVMGGPLVGPKEGDEGDWKGSGGTVCAPCTF